MGWPPLIVLRESVTKLVGGRREVRHRKSMGPLRVDISATPWWKITINRLRSGRTTSHRISPAAMNLYITRSPEEVDHVVNISNVFFLNFATKWRACIILWLTKKCQNWRVHTNIIYELQLWVSSFLQFFPQQLLIIKTDQTEVN